MKKKETNVPIEKKKPTIRMWKYPQDKKWNVQIGWGWYTHEINFWEVGNLKTTKEFVSKIKKDLCNIKVLKGWRECF